MFQQSQHASNLEFKDVSMHIDFHHSSIQACASIPAFSMHSCIQHSSNDQRQAHQLSRNPAFEQPSMSACQHSMLGCSIAGCHCSNISAFQHSSTSAFWQFSYPASHHVIYHRSSIPATQHSCSMSEYQHCYAFFNIPAFQNVSSPAFTPAY